jgi:predicted amidohydrolase
VGLTICYDIRFPALYTELACRGAADRHLRIVVLVRQTGAVDVGPCPGTDSMSYVAAAGQADPDGALTGAASSSGAPTGVGGSLVASPLGEVVASAGADPQLVVADIDVDKVAAARESIAVLRNRSSFAQVDKAQSLE